MVGSSADGEIFPKPYYTRVVKLLKALEEAVDETYYRSHWTEDILDQIMGRWALVDRHMRETFHIHSDDGKVKRLIEAQDRPKMHAFVHLKEWIMEFGAPLYYSTRGMEVRHKGIKAFAEHDNGRGQVFKRSIASDSRLDFCTRVIESVELASKPCSDTREPSAASKYSEHAKTVGFVLTPRRYKCRRRLHGILGNSSLYTKLGSPTTKANIEHTFAMFERLLQWAYADEYQLWPPGMPYKLYEWRMNNTEQLPRPNAREVLIHTSCTATFYNDGIVRKYRANPAWHSAKRRVFDFVQCRSPGGKHLYAQLLFFFTASLDHDGEKKTMKKAFCTLIKP